MKIDMNLLINMIAPEKRNRYIAYLLGADSWSNGFTFDEIVGLLGESDLDLIIGTLNVCIIYDKKKDVLYSVPMMKTCLENDLRYDFNGIKYLG